MTQRRSDRSSHLRQPDVAFHLCESVSSPNCNIFGAQSLQLALTACQSLCLHFTCGITALGARLDLSCLGSFSHKDFHLDVSDASWRTTELFTISLTMIFCKAHEIIGSFIGLFRFIFRIITSYSSSCLTLYLLRGLMDGFDSAKAFRADFLFSTNSSRSLRFFSLKISTIFFVKTVC